MTASMKILFCQRASALRDSWRSPRTLHTNDIIMSEKTFKILTIDGGGIKGLYSSKIIEHFEENFDCQMSDYFDMICGTSTGGILALGLSLKLRASEISNLYEEKGIEDTFGDKKIEDCDNLLCIPSYSYTDARHGFLRKTTKKVN